MHPIIAYLDGLGDGPVFRSDLRSAFSEDALEEWLLSGRTTPYRVVSPSPGTRGDVLVMRLTHPVPHEEWRCLVSTLRGVELYRAGLQFRRDH
jgi:hypothetical protein